MAWACRNEFSGAAEVRPGESSFRAEYRVTLRMGLQLRNAVRDRKAFEDFKEAKLTHFPYVLGTHPLVILL